LGIHGGDSIFNFVTLQPVQFLIYFFGIKQPQQVMYVYAPQGSYPVPGNPGLLAIPQGQPVAAPPGIYNLI